MNRLIVKLLVINLVVIGFVMAVMWLAIDTLAAGYFVTLMEKYHISPAPAHEMFVSAVHRYLIWACMAALFLAVLLSFIMMRRGRMGSMMCGFGSSDENSHRIHTSDSAMDILDKRYANGEIDMEEYEKKKIILTWDK